MIKWLIKAILNEGFIADKVGDEKADEIISKRISTCETCPKLHERKCLVCGCDIDLKAPMDFNKNIKKLMRVEKTHCPLGKWVGIDEKGEVYSNDKAIANHYRDIDNIKKLI